jgi:DUF3011 family protein
VRNRPSLLPVVLYFAVAATANFGQSIVTCSSEDGKRHYCNADTRYGVQMGRQRSGSPCTEGRSWGSDSRGIWVDRGCRADFIVQNETSSGRRRNEGSFQDGKIVSCASEDGKRHYCNVETRSGVSLVRQRSGSPCDKGSTWGVDDRGIWVDRGCRADFRLDGVAADDDRSRNSRFREYEGNDGACSIAAGDQEARRLVNQCLEVSTATRPPCNAQNSCRTIISEIRRGCAQAGNRAPAFCRDY